MKRRAPIEPIDVDVELDGVRVPFCVSPGHDEDPINRVLRGGFVTPEPAFRLVRELLPTGGCLLDVGAHIGIVALPAAALRGANVLALEASQWRAELLARAAGRLSKGSVDVVHGAAAERGGGWAALDGMVVREARAGDERVATTTIDDLLQSRGELHVDVLKLDVEGDEVSALRGARRLLEREAPPALVVESNALALERHGHTMRGLLELLEDAGYVLARIERDESRRLVRASSQDVQPEAIVDYVAQRGRLVPPRGWTVTDPSDDEVVERLLSTCVSLHPPYRSYAVSVIASAPDSITAHRAVRVALGALRRDPDEDVRAAAGAVGGPYGW